MPLVSGTSGGLLLAKLRCNRSGFFGQALIDPEFATANLNPASYVSASNGHQRLNRPPDSGLHDREPLGTPPFARDA